MLDVSGYCKMKFTSLLVFLILFISSCKETNEQLLDQAFRLSKQNKLQEAIKAYSDIIKKNKKIQLAYYNRGHCYFKLNKYREALWDFNKVMELHMRGNFIFSYNEDSPFADEEARTQVPYNDALYLRAQVKFDMDSLESSFQDFKILVADNYEEKSNCLLWLGTIWFKYGNTQKACEHFQKAKQFALTESDNKEAEKMISTYCQEIYNNR